MNQEFFGIFSEMMLETYHDVLIYDVEEGHVYILKTKRKPEVEETLIPKGKVFDYLEEKGITQMAERFIVGSLMDNILERAEKRQNGFLFVHRAIINGERKWMRVDMFVPKSYKNGDNKLLFCTSVMDNDTTIKHEIMMGIERNNLKLAKIYLDENRIESVHLTFNEKASMKYYKGSTFSEEVEYIAENLIHPYEKETYLKYMDLNNIRKYYKEGNTDYGFLCRRKSRKLYDWVYIRIIPTIDFSLDNMIFTMQVILIDMPIVNYVKKTVLEYNIYGGAKFMSEIETNRYVERIQIALGAFTYNFESFIEVDLESNRFVSFKPGGTMGKVNFPQEGDYTILAPIIIDDNYEGEEREKLRGFINLDNVKRKLTDSSSFSDTFRRKTGELIKITFAKTESKNGIPKIVNVTSEIVNENENQLKVITFGNFEVYDRQGKPISFEKKQSKQVLAYLIDRRGYPITNDDIICDILEKSTDDLNARKYASALLRKAMRDLEKAGFGDVIIKESNQARINKDAVDCDYYHLLDGNIFYWTKYQNEYMKEYSWAEETNSEIAQFFDK